MYSLYPLVYENKSVKQQNIIKDKNKMRDSLGDPEAYEDSEVVQKVSKSGIFSNKRLLVIRNGFLYYFSNIPKNYKKHVPNILNTFKEFPKSSIEIRQIRDIRMQSVKSCNLIIKFHEKDMIDREDIRKSVDEKNYVHQKKKGSDDLEEWKFTFRTVLLCRTWCIALTNLKTHFGQEKQKIQTFFDSFNPAKRNSQLPPEISSIFQIKAPQTSKSQTEKQIIQSFKLDDSKKKIQEQKGSFLIQNNNPEKTQQKKKPPIPMPIILPIDTESENRVKQTENSKKQEGKKQDAKREQKQLRKPMRESAALDIISQDDELKNKKIQQEIRQEVQEQIRAEEKQKAEKMMMKMREQIKQKENKIQLLQDDLKYMEEIEMRQKGKQAESLYKSIQRNEFSVQTDEEDEQTSPIKARMSYEQDFNSTQRDTYNLFRTTTESMSLEQIKEEKNYDTFDYYQQIGSIEENNKSFDQKMKKQIKIMNYVHKMKLIAEDTVKEYINQNQPQVSTVIQGSLFEVHIVCSRGKIINIQGTQKLVYSNKQHKKLKQQFKIYNYLQDKFIQMGKKKKNFPLRVPLCFHAEYKGYSALLKYMPYEKDLEYQQELKMRKKLLKVVGNEYVDCYTIKKIGNRQSNIYIISIQNPYKITQKSQHLNFRNNESLFGPRMIEQWRSSFVSLNSEQIQKQIKHLQSIQSSQNKKKTRSFNHILCCREAKDLYRSTQPFTNQDPALFFQTLLTSPQAILSLLSENIDCEVNGLFVSYLMYFYGLEFPKNFNVYEIEKEENINIDCTPVIRSFSLTQLNMTKMIENLGKYIEEDRFEMVQSSIQVLNQLSSMKKELTLLEIQYSMKKFKNDRDMIQKTANLLIQFKQELDKHDPLNFQLSMLLIQCLSRLGQHESILNEVYYAIDYLNYMYGSVSEGEQEDYMYLLAAETLAKMGKFHQAIIIYKKLFSNPENSLSQQQISLSLASVYKDNHSVNLNDLLEFLLSLVETSNSAESEWEAKMKIYIGEIYMKMPNIDQAIRYLQQALKYYQKFGVNDSSNVECLYEVVSYLIECYTLNQDREYAFDSFEKIAHEHNKNHSVFNQLINLKLDLITHTFCVLIKHQSTSGERSCLNEVLQQIRDDYKEQNYEIEPVTFQNLQKTLKLLIQHQELGIKQIKVIQQLKISEIQAFIFALNM